MKSHIMSIVISVHLKVVRYYQFKKRHHMQLLLKVFSDLEKDFPSKWRCPHGKPSTDEDGGAPQTQQLD